MISNQILQSTIDGLKGITRIDLCIIDTEGKVLASTFQDTDNYVTAALAFVESPADSQVFLGRPSWHTGAMPPGVILAGKSTESFGKDPAALPD